MITYNNKKYVCLLDLAMDLIRGKWKAVILCHLQEGPVRFLQLQRITGNVSHKVLIEKLKELEEDELIIKKVYSDNPPHVEYELTQRGKELTHWIKGIETWSVKYYNDVIEK